LSSRALDLLSASGKSSVIEIAQLARTTIFSSDPWHVGSPSDFARLLHYDAHAEREVYNFSGG
jgi:hypothetical protein